MKNKVTIKDVAEHANVSPSTVSRVINNKIGQNSKVAKQVWESVKALDYKPSAAARFMKGQNTGTIGIIVPDISNPFFADIVAGAISRAQEKNNNLLVASSNGSIDQEMKSLENLSRSVLDGLIYCPIARNEIFSEIEYFKNIPVVISYRRNIIKDIPHVYVDNVKGGYIATKYLMKLNRKNIAFVAGFWDPPKETENLLDMIASPEAGFYTSLDRFKGYLQALEEENLEYKPSLTHICNYSHKSGYEVAKEIFTSNEDVDGILAANDLVASGIIQFLTEQGISVPEDISVIGYDDGIIAPIINPSLTTINQYSHKIGEKSVDLIMDIIDGKEVNDYIVDVSLSIRRSTTFLKESE